MNFGQQFEKYDFPLLGLVRLPQVSISDEEKRQLGLNPNCSNFEFLKALTLKEFTNKKNKLAPDMVAKYFERAEYELNTFEELGFTDYVLLVWKVMNKLGELKGFRDYGRGSCAGSFVFGLLDITGVLDVIEKGLFFERFVSKTRSKKQVIDGITYLQGDLIADADLNLGGFRQDIVNWLNQIYKGKICKISAFSTLTGKILVKDIYKVMDDADENEAKRISDLVERNSGIVEDISHMPDKNPEFKQWSEENAETFHIALKLRNLIRQKTSHASGYFVSYYELDGFVPLELNKDKELTLAFEMSDASKFGTKLDLLGLTQNEILTDFFKQIPEIPSDIELDVNSIVYKNLQSDFLPYGLYQIGADCTYWATRKIQPKNILELSDINAIARPGALDYLDLYVDKSAKCPHPIFEQIVKNTRNLFLYQEQLMQALVAIGFSLDDAEICRKIVGKKLVKEVRQWKEKIRNKIEENKLPKELGDIVWKVLEDSSKYSFNRSHSLSTSKLSALTVWAKYKYPLQFYTACLNATKNLANPIDEITAIQKELSHFKINLLPPHILKSTENFKIEDGNIRFALNSIKGISDKTLVKLRNFCHPYSNKFEIMEAMQECGLGIGITSSIIACGAMDDFLTDKSRAATIMELSLYNLLTPNEKMFILRKNDNNECILGKQFNYDLIDIINYLKVIQPGDLKPKIKESRLKTLRKKFFPYRELYKHNVKNEDLCNYIMERNYLGFSYSQSIVDILKKAYTDIIPISTIQTLNQDDKVIIGGELSGYRITKSRQGNVMARCNISDGSGTAKIFMMEESWEKTAHGDKLVNRFLANEELNKGVKLEDGMIVMIEGKIGRDNSIFANKIVNQGIEIGLKISDITKKSEVSQDSP